jgi:hypothetical protein
MFDVYHGVLEQFMYPRRQRICNHTSSSSRMGLPQHWNLHVRDTATRTFADRIGRDGPISWTPPSPCVTPLVRVHGLATLRGCIRDVTASVTPGILCKKLSKT